MGDWAPKGCCRGILRIEVKRIVIARNFCEFLNQLLCDGNVLAMFLSDVHWKLLFWALGGKNLLGKPDGQVINADASCEHCVF
jgi:hypothetical protein